MGADGFAELVRLNGAKLIILATCDSITLGAKLARVTNVIAASTIIQIEEFADWERNFFSILAGKNYLSTAFEISRGISNIPLLRLMKGDLLFDIS
jgi:hypothetical protein